MSVIVTPKKQLPAAYAWLYNEPGPAMMIEALKHYGLLEKLAGSVTPDIRAWTKELGFAGLYPGDDFPWCGLFEAIQATRAGFPPPKDSLGAINWLHWGTPIALKDAMLWDTLIFSRKGGNHVCNYVGENAHAFLCYGGNQQDAVGFAGIEKGKCIGVRRAPWKIAQPANIRKIPLGDKFEMLRSAA